MKWEMEKSWKVHDKGPVQTEMSARSMAAPVYMRRTHWVHMIQRAVQPAHRSVVLAQGVPARGQAAAAVAVAAAAATAAACSAARLAGSDEKEGAAAAGAAGAFLRSAHWRLNRAASLVCVTLL